MIDRETANELCRSAGVRPVPEGVDPESWLADNDVFPPVGAVDDVMASVVTTDDIKQQAEDRKAVRVIIDGAKGRGFVHVTAMGSPLDWREIQPGALWAGYYTGADESPVAYRHDYGNARVYYVAPDLLDECVHAWWMEQIQVGYQVTGDSIAAVRWAASHALEMRDKYPDCLGGEDAVRFVDKVGRESLERMIQ